MRRRDGRNARRQHCVQPVRAWADSSPWNRCPGTHPDFPVSAPAMEGSRSAKFGQGAGSGKGQGSSGDGDEFDLEEELVMTWKLPEDGIEPACDEAEMDELRGKCEVIGLFIFRYFNVRKYGGVRFPSFADHHFISIFFSPQDLIYSCISPLSLEMENSSYASLQGKEKSDPIT